MRIPKKGAAPPSSKERKSKSEASSGATGPDRRRVASDVGEPLGLSEALYDHMFRAKDVKRPMPARRTTARVQRAFADAFLDESAPLTPPPPLKER